MIANKIVWRILYLSLTLILTSASGFAKVRLPGVFGDNMVLQQRSQVALWGRSRPNISVSITPSWDKKIHTTKANADGKWLLKIATPQAGGPFNISFNDGESLILKNILIGEVWVCSGQSNMQMPLKGNGSPILNAAEIIMDADNPNLRLFKVGRAATSDPKDNTQAIWMQANSENARDFSALAFQFGQILQKKLKVPIGLIQSTVGGTPIEAWMSKNTSREFPEIQLSLNVDTIKDVNDKKRYPTVLFNGMISPIVGFEIKGFFWMQGESNKHNPEQYEKYFPAMVKDWRKQWGQGNIPFYYVQITPVDSKDTKRSGPRLREAQFNASKLIPNSGMIASLDVGMELEVHAMDKTTLAQRASYWAIGQTYGVKGIAYKSPVLSSIKIEGSKCILAFDDAPNLTSFKKPLTLFEVAGVDQVFYPAKAEINANKVIVQSDKVVSPVAVRYAYKEYVKGELYNNDGLPASSFRTDSWKLPHEK